MDRRVVVTGIGVVAPNGIGKQEFTKSLREGKSGIRFIEDLKEFNFSCQVGGTCEKAKEKLDQYFTEEALFGMNEGIIYGCMAAMEAWKDAGLEIPKFNDDKVNWDTGCVVGVGQAGMDDIQGIIDKIKEKKIKRLGSTVIERTMVSGISAKMAGIFALGNEVTTNSSACNTGTEAIIMGYQRIKDGRAERMVVGGSEASVIFLWAGFDAMRVLSSSYNDQPEKASRPMSASAAGFVPGSGAGILIIESLEAAQKRGARIYAEIIGADVNCGGHRMGGSITAPNPISVQKCIQAALKEAKIEGREVDAINGHLTATFADPYEVDNWAKGLNVSPKDFPYINSTKSMIGHCLGAAGAIESVASIIEIENGFLHKSLNSEDVHEKIAPYADKVVQNTKEMEINILAKASFGFGDVNGCMIFKKWK